MKLVGKESAEDEALYRAAVRVGCKPVWHDGILGWAWHCTCRDGRHAMDQQCSALSLESVARAS